MAMQLTIKNLESYPWIAFGALLQQEGTLVVTLHVAGSCLYSDVVVRWQDNEGIAKGAVLVWHDRGQRRQTELEQIIELIVD